MQPRYLTELDAVRAYVDARYQGAYLTRLDRIGSAGRVYETRLHSIDGPAVFTLVKPDGTIEDRTR